MLILIAAHPITLLWLAFGPSPLPPLPTLPPGLAEKAAQAPADAGKLGDIARWNDRTSPRKTLETFYFAITGYDRSPGLIVNAIDCLDLDGLDPEMRERDAALLAHQLEFVLNRQAIPLYGIPERPEADRVVLDEIEGAADRPGPSGRRPMAVRRGDRRPDRQAAEALLPRPARHPGGACEAGGRADGSLGDLAHLRGGRDGPARLHPGRGVPRPPRRPAQAPRLEGGGDGAQARLRDAALPRSRSRRRSPTTPTGSATSGTPTTAAGSCSSGSGSPRARTPGSSPGAPCATSTPWSRGSAPGRPTPGIR